MASWLRPTLLGPSPTSQGRNGRRPLRHFGNKDAPISRMAARLVHANRKEVLDAKMRTREQRQARKRLEREGTSHRILPKTANETPKANWLPVDELEEVEWLKPINL